MPFPLSISFKFKLQTGSKTWVSQQSADYGCAETRRISVPHTMDKSSMHKQPINYVQVVRAARSVFGVPDNFVLSLLWQDEDGDRIDMSSEAEFREYLKHLGNPPRTAAPAPAPRGGGGGGGAVLVLGVTAGPREEPRPDAATHGQDPLLGPVRKALIGELKEELCTRQQKNEQNNMLFTQLKAARAKMVERELARKEVEQREIEEQERAERESACVRGRIKATQSAYAGMKAEAAALLSLEQSAFQGGVPQPPSDSAPRRRHYSLSATPGSISHTVAPDSVYEQTWVIRNNGLFDIKHGIKIKVTASKGEPICSPSFSKSLGPIKVNEEKSISVLLVSPKLAGQHSATFRLMLPCGAFVGPPLEVAVQCDPAAVSAKRPVPPVPSLIPTLRSRPRLFEPYKPCGTSAASAPHAPSSAALLSAKNTLMQARAVVIVPTPTPTPAPVNPVAHMWRVELGVIMQMGFTDVETIVDLLQKHVKQPTAAAGGRSGSMSLSNVALNTVVAELLGASDTDSGFDHVDNNADSSIGSSPIVVLDEEDI
jgi:hypothetical protein